MQASSALHAGDTTTARNNDRAVALWLLLCCAMILAMAVIGAITRLTESGLSIMEWAPVAGILPPLSQTEWERLFALYRGISEYQEVNAGMTLAEFRTIFWWEYVHRLWGRLIGFVFLIPFLWFLLRGRLRRSLTPHLVMMFLLGGLQGGMGWYMVASGFADRVDVSHYRLVVHLVLALLIYAYVFVVALRLLEPTPAVSPDLRTAVLRLALMAFLALLAVTIASGGLVAGLNAGLVYNSFPLMDGELFPEGYGQLKPWALNAFDNIVAVQFNHRLLAVATVVAAATLWLWSRRMTLVIGARRACDLLFVTAALQLGLGIATLILVVPVVLAAVHQAGAVLLLTATLWALHKVRGAGFAYD